MLANLYKVMFKVWHDLHFKFDFSIWHFSIISNSEEQRKSGQRECKPACQSGGGLRGDREESAASPTLGLLCHLTLKA
jgi:hypothetical protein